MLPNNHHKNCLVLYYYLLALFCCMFVQLVFILALFKKIFRDLKLGNIVLDKRNQSVTITNFCLGKHLMNDKVNWLKAKVIASQLI
jgi:serine/threonine protein kinase